MFLCTWGKAAYLKRKSCAVKGLETKLWHKLCRENTRGQKTPKKDPTPKTLVCCCNLLDLSEGKYLPPNLFKIFQSRLTQGRREMLIPLCMFWVRALVPVAVRRESSRAVSLGAETQQGWAGSSSSALRHTTNTLGAEFAPLKGSERLTVGLVLRTPLQRPFV